MIQKKTVWVNHNPEKVDLTYLQNHIINLGYEFIAKEIPNNEDDVIINAKNADVIVSAAEPWTKKVLSTIAGQNKYIQRYGTGVENIDIPAATSLGIPVGNAAGANAVAVAETALFHILNVARRFSWSVEGVRKGMWPCREAGREIDAMTIGLVGFGNIAQQLARLLSGFTCKIVAFDPFLKASGIRFANEHNVSLLDNIDEVFKASDIVSLHIPYTDSTAKSINYRLFSLMKPGSFIVNTCRGGVINEIDLAKAIQDGILNGAGLDVLSKEPPEDNNPLLHLDRVYITSHVAATTWESELKTQKMIANAIEEFLSGKIPSTCLNPVVFNK